MEVGGTWKRSCPTRKLNRHTPPPPPPPPHRGAGGTSLDVPLRSVDDGLSVPTCGSPSGWDPQRGSSCERTCLENSRRCIVFLRPLLPADTVWLPSLSEPAELLFLACQAVFSARQNAGSIWVMATDVTMGTKLLPAML